MNERITTYNLLGYVKIAVQEGTEKVNLSQLLQKDTEIHVNGNGFEARIVISPSDNPHLHDLCRIGLIIKEGIE